MTTTKNTKAPNTKADEAEALTEEEQALHFIAATLAPFTVIANPTERATAMWMAAFPLVGIKAAPHTDEAISLAKATLYVLLNGIKAAHTQARTAGRPAFDEATKAFKADFDKACEPARKAFDEATKAFREQYETACKPFAHLLGDESEIEASYKTLRTACLNMRGDMGDAPALFSQGRKAKADEGKGNA